MKNQTTFEKETNRRYNHLLNLIRHAEFGKRSMERTGERFIASHQHIYDGYQSIIDKAQAQIEELNKLVVEHS